MVILSVLDLSPIPEGSDAGQALRNSLSLARHAENHGYRRYWMAEHHNLPGIASAATAVALAHIAAGTETIRVGAGGIMLPNHAPLLIAEQFGTLAALHPGRIDLGLGRAPGSDQTTARAMRRNLAGDSDRFPQDVMELMHYFEPAEPGQAVQAVPGAGLEVPIWLLGSSLFSAQVAAALGLPFAFASHFAPDQLGEALDTYRREYTPSPQWPKPYSMAAIAVIAAPTDEEAAYLFTSQQQSFMSLRRGRPGPLPPPVKDLNPLSSALEQAMVNRTFRESVVGSPDTVKRGIEAFLGRTQVDELMITGAIFDHAARRRSLEIVAGLRPVAAAIA